MDAISKRIDGTLLQDNQGKLVRIIGKLEQHDGNSAILISNGSIQLNLSAITSNINIEINNNYEIIGKVGDDLLITVYSILEISDNFNFDNYYKLCGYVSKVPELYYQA